MIDLDTLGEVGRSKVARWIDAGELFPHVRNGKEYLSRARLADFGVIDWGAAVTTDAEYLGDIVV